MSASLQFLVKLFPQRLLDLVSELRFKGLANAGLDLVPKLLFGGGQRLHADALGIGVHLVASVDLAHVGKRTFDALLEQEVKFLRETIDDAKFPHLNGWGRSMFDTVLRSV